MRGARIWPVACAATAMSLAFSAVGDAPSAPDIQTRHRAIDLPSAPPGPNPVLSTIGPGMTTDWAAWTEWLADVSEAMGPVTLAAAQATIPEVEPNGTLATANALNTVGTGPGELRHVVVTGSIVTGFGAPAEADLFRVQLEAGDIVGVNLLSAPAAEIALVDATGRLRIRAIQDLLADALPLESPLPRGGRGQTYAYVVDQAGAYTVRVRPAPLSSGQPPVEPRSYQLEIAVQRPPLQTAAPGQRQILFVDFNGATIPGGVVSAIPTTTTLPGLASSLGAAGLAGQENAIIDGVLAVMRENLKEDPVAQNLSLMTDIEIRNSRDHADPFGQPNVSRVVIGGSVAPLGPQAAGTIGIASTVDIGNFSTDDTAVIFLDTITPAGVPFLSNSSLTRIPLAQGVTYRDLVIRALGNFASHEAGHFIGNLHTSAQNEFENLSLITRPENIMDEGAFNLFALVGEGPDGVFGSADDVDVDFGHGMYSLREGFTTLPDPAVQDTLANVAFETTSPCIRRGSLEHFFAGRVAVANPVFPGFNVSTFTALGEANSYLLLATRPAGDQLTALQLTLQAFTTEVALRPTGTGNNFTLCEPQNFPLILIQQ